MPKKRKYTSESEATPCVVCGNPATRLNKKKEPVCRNHLKGIVELYCPQCKMKMQMRQGKFGYFWGCTGFPRCDKTISLRQGLEQNKREQ